MNEPEHVVTARESLELIRSEAYQAYRRLYQELDAAAKVEFTPLGIGTTRGEMLAQIAALADNSLELLDRIEKLEGRKAHGKED